MMPMFKRPPLMLMLAFIMAMSPTPAPAVGSTDQAKVSPFVIEGKVTDAAGKPMDGVAIDVNAGWCTLMPTGSTKTGPDGKYAVHFRPGRVSTEGEFPANVQMQAAIVHASRDGYYEKDLCRGGNLSMAGKLPAYKPANQIVELHKPTSDSTVVLPGKPYRLDFVMVPAARVSGRIVDRKGKPIAGLRFDMEGPTYPGGSVLAGATTDKDGFYILTSVPCKTYAIGFSNKGHKIRSNEMAFSHPGKYMLELVHDRHAGTLTGRFSSQPAEEQTTVPLQLNQQVPVQVEHRIPLPGYSDRMISITDYKAEKFGDGGLRIHVDLTSTARGVKYEYFVKAGILDQNGKSIREAASDWLNQYGGVRSIGSDDPVTRDSIDLNFPAGSQIPDQAMLRLNLIVGGVYAAREGSDWYVYKY